jgi:osmotically-inducible protein OsmY
MLPEKLLRTEVEQGLRDDPELDAGRISVAVEGDTVTLSGEVVSPAARSRAVRVTEGVAGVRVAVDHLTVDVPEGATRDDAEIARAAAHALDHHTDVPESVTATVEQGWVTLHGHVPWAEQREAAELAVRAVPGIAGVQNLISLRPPAGGAPPVGRRVLYRLRSLHHGWVAVEDRLEECERYLEGLVEQVELAPTARARALALSMITQLVAERWDEAQERWVIDPNPVLERVRREHGLTVT